MKKKQSTGRTESSRGFNIRVFIVAFVALGVLGALYIVGEQSNSGTVFSQQNSFSKEKQKAKKYRATRNFVVDKVTGEARKPTDAELEQVLESLEKLANTSLEGLEEYPLEGGGYGVDLQGRFQGVFLARPKSDGTLEVRCVFTFEEGLEFLGIVEDTTVSGR